MKKLRFTEHILPHIIAVSFFLLVTIFFFNPVFFDNKSLQQGDILQWEGSSKALRDFRDATGEEGLWAPSMFSGMPAYLINVEWGNTVVSFLKKVLAFSLPHPIANIYLAFLCYYILLLSFRIRPYLAIAGAIAFGLSSYMIIGLIAGHNGRIGAIAFIPLIMAGIHLAFTQKKIVGFGLTAAGFALHLRENHVQITYYFIIIVAVYGIIQLLEYVKQKNTLEYFKTLGILVVAVAIGLGTFIGPLWSVAEYSAYSRGQSELTTVSNTTTGSGLSKAYAFEHSNGIMEPLMLLIPNINGGSSGNYLFLDQESETYKSLVSLGDERSANQLAPYTTAYWGQQPGTMPYYAGAIIVFLFAVGIAFAPKKYVWWLVSCSIFAIILTWGSNFAAFNYFIFDYLPGYNKFRSVTFALIITLFSLPLLGFLGLESLLQRKPDKDAKRKLLISFAATGGLCVLILLVNGMFSYEREGESQLPPWLISAMADDRQSLLISDAFRSLGFILAAFILLYFDIQHKSAIGFYAFFIIMITIDLAVVDKRYLTEDNFKRNPKNAFFAITEADQEILKDKSYYRVYNLQGPMVEARTSYFHNSLGGYHGAKLRRYQDLYDSCLVDETNELIQDVQGGKPNYDNYDVLNMLNAKYIVFGPQRNNILFNTSANGNAWFVNNIVSVQSANEEIQKVSEIDTRTTAVIDESKFPVEAIGSDTSATINLLEHQPNYLKYEGQSSSNGLAVFSEIYYDKGWVAYIDGVEAPIIRANYVLRALYVPSGKHTIEFRFQPKAYTTGNAITTASSWLMLIVLLGSLVWAVRREK